MSDNTLTAPLRSFRPYARWVVHPAAASPETIVLCGPGLFDHGAAVVPFVHAVLAAGAAAAWVRPDKTWPALPIPGGDKTLEPGGPVERRTAVGHPHAPADPFCRWAWWYWRELLSEAEAATRPSLLRGDPAYAWDFWYAEDGRCEAKFVGYADQPGQTQPAYDIPRMSLEDLGRALDAPSALARLARF